MSGVPFDHQLREQTRRLPDGCSVMLDVGIPSPSDPLGVPEAIAGLTQVTSNKRTLVRKTHDDHSGLAAANSPHSGGSFPLNRLLHQQLSHAKRMIPPHIGSFSLKRQFSHHGLQFLWLQDKAKKIIADPVCRTISGRRVTMSLGTENNRHVRFSLPLHAVTV